MNFFQIIFLFLFGFNILFSIGCSEGSKALPSKPGPEDPVDPTDPGLEFNIKSPDTSNNPSFTIGQLPDIDVTISLFKGPNSNSKCEDSNLEPLGDPIAAQASQNEITINNLGSLLNISNDGTYSFFIKINGQGFNHCFNVKYILDTTKPQVIANPTSNTTLENDDTSVMSKTWNWACRDREYGECAYRYKIDNEPLQAGASSCTSYTFPPNEPYSDIFTATKTGGDGKYCIHIQAKDDVGNESDVVSVYAALDGTVPTISQVGVPSKNYSEGDSIDVTVTFSEPVEVTGSPRIELTFGANGGQQTQTQYADYQRGSGSTELVFRYSVASVDSDDDGIEMADSIDLNSGSIKDIAGNSLNSLTFTRPTNLSGVLVEGDRANVILSETNLSIGENGGTGTYTVRLNKAPLNSNSVTVVLSSADGSVATVSPSILTFEAHNNNNNLWSTPKTVTVTGVDDNIDNDVGSNPRRTTNINHSITSGDTNFNSLTLSPVEITSRDDDNIGRVELTLNPASVNENSGTVPISVTAQFDGSTSGGQTDSSVRLADDLSISISVYPLTAQNGDINNPVPDFQVNILAGNNQGTGNFNLAVVDDEIGEEDETFILRGSNSLGLTVGLETLTIVDNDEKGITVSPLSLSVLETGGTETYTVKLNSQPTGPVAVVLSSADTNVATVSPSVLTFEADDSNGKLWSNPQTVTVTGVESSSTSDLQTTVTHRVSGGGYTGAIVDDVSVTSIDRNSRVTINSNPSDILADNYDSYSVSGTCNSGGGNVSVQVGSLTEKSTSCTNGLWTADNIDTSTLTNGTVTITVTQTVASVDSTASADVKKCVSSGDGTSSSSPHWVCEYEGLKNMFSVNTRKYFILGRDIDARDSWTEGQAGCGAYDGSDIHDTDPCSGWTPLNVNDSISDGEFDGQDYTIRNLYINSDTKKDTKKLVGLFGDLKIKVKNLHLADVSIHSTSTSGSDNYIGGIAGETTKSIENCSVTGTLFSSHAGSIGGLIGRSSDTDTSIVNSYVNVSINAGDSSNVGGLSGRLSISLSMVMSSYSKGNFSIDGKRGNIGGLVGQILLGDIHSSYSHAEVSGGASSGGLVGEFQYPTLNKVTHSYSLGGGSPDDPLFPGVTSLKSSTGLFWDTDVGGDNSEAPNSEGLTTANMQLSCSNSSTTGICALGEGFSFSSGSYPKVKKCTTCDAYSPVFGDVLAGQ